MNQSYIMLKPDCIERNLSEQVFEIIKENGFVIEEEKDVEVTEEIILKHYEEVIAKINTESFKNSILRAFVGKQVHAMIITNQTEDCISKFRDLLGKTDPSKAGPETLRGRFGIDSMEKAMTEGRMLNNLIHASDCEESAKKEIALWFK